MRKLFEALVKYKIWSNVIILVIFAAGLLSFMQIKQSFFPLFSEKFINVQVIYPGASPEELEEGVVLKIEDGLKGMEGIKEITSVSRENAGSVQVEITSDADIDAMVTEVKNAVDRINSFPANAEKPIISKVKARDGVGTLVLQGDVSLKQLKTYAESIEDDLLATGFITQVAVQGVPELEISVEIPESDLIRNRLTFTQIAAAIRNNNTDISAGSIKSSSEEILIRSRAKKYNPDELGEIVLRSNTDGSQLRLGDIATITEQFTDVPEKTIYNGNQAVSVNVTKLNEEDIIQIIDYLNTYIPEFNQAHPEVDLVLSQDQSEALRDRISLLLENGLVGLAMVLLTLGLFLSLRLSFWVAFGIPFSFIGMFIAMSIAGITINVISLFGMILVIGILVDDGIVIAENVYSHFERGKSPIDAAIDGCIEILPAVFASVLTTIIVFTVFFYIEGDFGEFMQAVGFVVIATLAFSLIEATFVLPAHLGSDKVLSNKPPTNIFGKAFQVVRNVTNTGINFIKNQIYGRSVAILLKHKYVAILLPVLFLVLVFSAVKGGLIKGALFPNIDSDQVTASVVLAPGTREQVTEDIMNKVAEEAWKVNAYYEKEKGMADIIENIQLNIGSGGGETGGHTGNLTFFLKSGEERGDILSQDVTNEIRKRATQLPDMKQVKKVSFGGRSFFGKPIEVSLLSDKKEELESFKQELKDKLNTYVVLKDITDNDVDGRREIQIKLTDKAYILGFTHSEISRQIRQGFFGEEVQRLQKGTDEVRIWVRYPPEDRKNIGKMEQLKIKTLTGAEYPLTELVTYDIGRSVVNINHLDGRREIKIEGDLTDQDEDLQAIITELETDVIPVLQEKYPSVRYELGGQAQGGQELGSSLSTALPLALIAVIILIALVFRSFSQAFMVLPMIFIAVGCAALGHGIEDILQGDVDVPVSILSIYGIIALVGIIVNDTVIFLDKYNLLLREGYTVKKAAYDAGIARFRPILLTSITTVAGLYPIILETSSQAQFLKPMAISIAYGVLFGTFFILWFFPVLILAVNDLRRLISGVSQGAIPTAESVEPTVVEKKKLKELVR